MAFAPEDFIPVSAMANSNASRIFSYTSTGDNLVTVKGANYFDLAADPTGGLGLTDGDVILARASDGVSFLDIAVTAGAATTASANDFV